MFVRSPKNLFLMIVVLAALVVATNFIPRSSAQSQQGVPAQEKTRSRRTSENAEPTPTPTREDPTVDSEE